MLKITWWNESDKKITLYETIEDVISGEDVKAFIEFIKEGELENPSNTDEEVENLINEIEEELEACTTFRRLNAVFKEYFDYTWTGLEIEEIE